MWLQIEKDIENTVIVNTAHVVAIKMYDRKLRHVAEPASLEGKRGEEYFDENNEYWSQVIYFCEIITTTDNDNILLEFSDECNRDDVHVVINKSLSPAFIVIPIKETE